MKRMLFTFMLLNSFLLLSVGNVFANNGCGAATTECIDRVLPSVGYNSASAARACAGGVLVECIDRVLPSVNYNNVSAAVACKGGVTLDCIERVLSSVGYNAKKAADACAGRD